MILQEMYENIECRARNPVPNSATNKLLDQGLERIGEKVFEESIEVVLAAMKEGKSELIREISDLVYMTLVLMFEQGISLQDIEQQLRERQKVTGNARVPRTTVEQKLCELQKCTKFLSPSMTLKSQANQPLLFDCSRQSED